MLRYRIFKKLPEDCCDVVTEKKSNGYSPRSLQGLCSSKLCQAKPSVLTAAILSIPLHLADMLLREAVILDDTSTIVAIIRNWPSPILWCVIITLVHSFFGLLAPN